MGTTAVAVLLLLFLALVPAALAVTFQVGDGSGWTTNFDYKTWVSGKIFRVGDTLEFKYDPSHSISVVDKAGYNGCDSSGAKQSFSGGVTTINLTTVGTIYFLSPTPGHCLGGMRLAVPVRPAKYSLYPPEGFKIYAFKIFLIVFLERLLGLS